MLDVIGDLALVGFELRGHLVVHCGGHALHTALAAELLRQREAWQFVDAWAPESVSVPSGAGVRAAAN
jgi:UDP-3-O-[3-hydroxymyristoyl] N-acetylglucosamine deacetylase